MRDLTSIKPRVAQLRQIRTVLLGPSPGRAASSVASSAFGWRIIMVREAPTLMTPRSRRREPTSLKMLYLVLTAECELLCFNLRLPTFSIEFGIDVLFLRPTEAKVGDEAPGFWNVQSNSDTLGLQNRDPSHA
jgi:hypothetical protein